jgi:hypothetical protein
MRLFGFCGYAQSGKDTAASFLVEQGFKRLAFADILRQSLYNLNPIVVQGRRVQEIVDAVSWDVAKVEFPEIRELLQRMGTEVGRELYGENFWVDRVMSQVKSNGDYVITDVRFPNEEAAVRQAGGRVLRIVREGVGAVNGHVSDTGVDSLRIDGAILNTGSLEEFKAQVLALVV